MDYSNLKALDERFLSLLPDDLRSELLERRLQSRVEESAFLEILAPFLDAFWKVMPLEPLTLAQDFRQNYLKRHVFYKTSLKDLEGVDIQAIRALFERDGKADADLILKAYKEHSKDLEIYCAWSVHSPEGLWFHRKNKLLNLPQKTDVALKTPHTHDDFQGFDLRDKGLSLEGAKLEAKYCLICHPRGKDSCRTGCPLGQKISEMIDLFNQGYVIGALSVAMVDNPMILATGHRICYDCVMGCIFKTQTPVDVPGIETAIVKHVLNLPNGFEILKTLSFWNPLKNQPLPLTKGSYKVLVVGAGPAGFTLSLELLKRGVEVVLIDALQSFGGVMDYGITSRWDKTFLGYILELLQSHTNFSYYPSVRFGEMLTLTCAKELGFDHIALCVGAAKPKLTGLEAKLPGIITANDFLMSINQGKPYIEGSATKVDIQYPVVVLGAGLSGVDAAVEAVHFGQSRNVSMLYRQEISKSPALTQNAHEIQDMVNCGVQVLDNRDVLEIEGSARIERIVVWNKTTNTREVIEGKTLIIAAGTEGATQIHDEMISYFGDANPKFRGSVVKALASVKAGISELMERFKQPVLKPQIDLDDLLTSRVQEVNVISPDLLELCIRSPLIAQNAKLGQYVKAEILKSDETVPLKPIALRIGKVLKDQGSFYVHIWGAGQTSKAFFDVAKVNSVELEYKKRGAPFIEHKQATSFDVDEFKSRDFKGQKLSIIGPLGDHLDLPQNAKCYVPTPLSPNDFYEELKNALLQKGCTVSHVKNDSVFEWAYCDGEVSSKVQIQTTKAPFMCMMQGLCGKCLVVTTVMNTEGSPTTTLKFGCMAGVEVKD